MVRWYSFIPLLSALISRVAAIEVAPIVLSAYVVELSRVSAL